MHRRTRTTLLATIAAAGALAAPGAAQAAFVATGTVWTGDNGDDTLIIGEDTGVYTHNIVGGGFASPRDFDNVAPGEQTVPAGTALTINTGGGRDTLTVTAANAGPMTVDGGADDDVLTGGNAADTLNGGAGNDRLVGARGADVMNGDAGNDVLVWNNGDGSDVMDGGAGADEIEVNGAPTAGDDFRIGAGAAPNSILFRRVNLGQFSLAITTAERMAVNALGGDDDITAEDSLGTLILLALHGGPGNDRLVGSPNADLLTGGDGDDDLAGRGGDDRLVGDRGSDVMDGQAGDDTMVWNNGDGSDVMRGRDGTDRVEVNGASTAGDVFTVAPNGDRVRFDRTNLGPFTLDKQLYGWRLYTTS